MHSSVADLRIELRQVAALIPYIRNAKQHSDAQVAQIAASITEFGWGAPILVDGHNNVIAGHGRLLAARKLGMTEVPVVPMAHLTDIQRRALILADNKIGENASWDDELLGLELAELKEGSFDLSLTGFSADEWDALIAGDASNEGLTDDDQVRDLLEAWLQHIHHGKIVCRVAAPLRAVKANRHAELLADVDLRVVVKAQKRPWPDPIRAERQVPCHASATVGAIERLGEFLAGKVIVRTRS